MITNNTELVRYQDSVTGADVALSIADIKKSICPLATDQEAINFLQLCKYMGLNPFVRDAYLIKYGKDAEATMVVGKDAFTKRAEAHPQFSGMSAGVVVRSGDAEPVERKGSLSLDGEKIVGGWAHVYRNAHKIPTEITVKLEEFSTGRGPWQKMPGTMIRKVALVTALREAFPSTFSGMYDSAEMKLDLDEQLEPLEQPPPRIIETSTVMVDASADVIISNDTTGNHLNASGDGGDVEYGNTAGSAGRIVNDPVIHGRIYQLDEAEDVVVIDRTAGSDPDPVIELEDATILVVESDDEADIPESSVSGEDLVLQLEDSTMSPMCTMVGHGDGVYEVMESPATGERRWVHNFLYSVNGDVKTGRCVYEGPVPVPSKA